MTDSMERLKMAHDNLLGQIDHLLKDPNPEMVKAARDVAKATLQDARSSLQFARSLDRPEEEIEAHRFMIEDLRQRAEVKK